MNILMDEVYRKLEEAEVRAAQEHNLLERLRDCATLAKEIDLDDLATAIERCAAMVPEICPHGNELTLDEDGSCGCRLMESE